MSKPLNILAKILVTVFLYGVGSGAISDDLGTYQGSPLKTWASIRADGIGIRTFGQKHENNPQILRRYLQYVPKGITQGQLSYPLVIALHGANTSAELFRRFSLSDRMERMADREGFILAYGNGYSLAGTQAPLVVPEPLWANLGYWRTCLGAPNAEPNFNNVDDVGYIETMIANMLKEGLPIDVNRIYVMGLSNGGEMALHLAREKAELFAGVAAVVPTMGLPATETFGACSAKAVQAPTSIIMIYSKEDPILVPAFKQFDFDYGELLESAMTTWALALGIEVNTEVATQLPSLVKEGAFYQGSHPALLATRNSYVIRKDYKPAASNASFTSLQMVNAGHHWPVRKVTPLSEVIAEPSFGFNNHDIQAEEVIWRFFKNKRRISSDSTSKK